MIIGGAYQGKADYAKAQFPDVDWKFGGEITEEELLKAAGVLGFQEYIRKALKAGEDLTGLAEKLAQQDPDVILVSEEVGYGIVPADAFERQYREAVGWPGVHCTGCKKQQGHKSGMRDRDGAEG